MPDQAYSVLNIITYPIPLSIPLLLLFILAILSNRQSNKSAKKANSIEPEQNEGMVTELMARIRKLEKDLISAELRSSEALEERNAAEIKLNRVQEELEFLFNLNSEHSHLVSSNVCNLENKQIVSNLTLQSIEDTKKLNCIQEELDYYFRLYANQRKLLELYKDQQPKIRKLISLGLANKLDLNKFV